MGSLMPLLPLILRQEKGLTEIQIGTALSLMSVASLFSPALLTLMADTHFDPRKILAAALASSAAALGALAFSSHQTLVILLVGLYGLALVAVVPLQDGFYFAAARQQVSLDQATPSYPLVRVWGTVGFIVPSLLFLIASHLGAPVSAGLYCAIIFCLAGAVNAWFLPPLPKKIPHQKKSLPTLDATRALLSRDGIPFCIALALASLASTFFYGFFPLYLKDVTGIGEAWVGPVINYGVFLEIFVTLSIPWMIAKIGVKSIFVLGFAVMALRMFVLAASPPIAVVVLVQTFHGLEVAALFILPAIYLNRLAGDQFQSSMQGVYAMFVAGTSKVIGYTLAGKIAAGSLSSLFLTGGTLAALASIITLIFLRRTHDSLHSSGTTPPT